MAVALSYCKSSPFSTHFPSYSSQLSSLHITFPSESEWSKLSEKGFLQRIGMQYHWKNRNYKSFDDFFMDMKRSKRKNIRQELKKKQDCTVFLASSWLAWW